MKVFDNNVFARELLETKGEGRVLVINACDIGVRALASHPVKPNKNRVGEVHTPIYIGGAFVRDGEWLYADSDGILVSKTELSI
ncbi:4-hydroxy-4-methyl-2-oxoglutarate aldolase [Thalictrum thalictroides]|uniref:4-hydroxy-4-methyl-2-oxoglutarate aldolase n=1 Tax=Thalictrum thalictroides TaxID=46969 RepID=A0A7J6WCA9_THATH|nr:4-hydroxy-4-methyl-2-oxoglutarate aldolase [Thalictrum thalictroides]